MLFVSGLAIGQSSTEPIQRLPGGKPLEAMLGVPLTQTAWAAALVGIGTCYESPVTETPGLQGCLEDHATGTVQDMGPACRRHDPRRGRVVQAQKEFGKSFPAPEWYQPNRYYTTAQNLVTTTITASGGTPAEPIGSHRTERWGRLEGDELYPRGNHLGSSVSH